MVGTIGRRRLDETAVNGATDKAARYTRVLLWRVAELSGCGATIGER